MTIDIEQIAARQIRRNQLSEPSRKGLDAKLLHAVLEGHEFVVSALLEAGADPNAADTAGNSALKLAASRGHTRTAKLLLEGFAKPDPEALLAAIRNGYVDTASALLKRMPEPGSALRTEILKAASEYRQSTPPGMGQPLIVKWVQECVVIDALPSRPASAIKPPSRAGAHGHARPQPVPGGQG